MTFWDNVKENWLFFGFFIALVIGGIVSMFKPKEDRITVYEPDHFNNEDETIDENEHLSENDDSQTNYYVDEDLYSSMVELVVEDLSSPESFRNQWFSQAKEISKIAGVTKEEINEWINSNPKKLFEFAYSQYQDPSSPLYHISIPMIKTAGILGYQDALIFLSSHCINRLDRNEATYGFALLNELSKRNVGGAKHILGFLYYNGWDLLDIKPNLKKAGQMMFDIQNEDFFLQDGAAMTILAMLVMAGFIEFEENKVIFCLYDKNGNRINETIKNLSEVKMNPEFIDENGILNPGALFDKASDLEIPFAQIGWLAYNRVKDAMQEMADAFERGYFFADGKYEVSNQPEGVNIPEETLNNMRVQAFSNGATHWYTDFKLVHRVPISGYVSKIYREAIMQEDNYGEADVDDLNIALN